MRVRFFAALWWSCVWFLFAWSSIPQSLRLRVSVFLSLCPSISPSVLLSVCLLAWLGFGSDWLCIALMCVALLLDSCPFVLFGLLSLLVGTASPPLARRRCRMSELQTVEGLSVWHLGTSWPFGCLVF